MRGDRKQEARGYTLLELMMAMAIALLIMGFGLPALENLLLRTRTTATANDLLGILESSRQLAFSKRVPVTVCAVESGQCGRSWRRVIMVFQDKNRNGRREEGEVLQLEAGTVPEGFWLVWKPFRKTTYLTWASTGQTDSMNGTFTLCNQHRRPDLLRQFVISRIGRVRLVRPVSAAASYAAQRACGW